MFILPVTINLAPELGIGTFFRITDVGTLISGILGAALLFAGIFFVLYFIWGAFRWLTSGGDKAQVENARSKITNAAIGLALVAVTWAVYLLVIYFLGLQGAINISGESGGDPVGNANCVCGGAGGCATTGQVGPIGFGGACYQCTDAGWAAVGGSCGPITCASCP